MAVSIAVVAVTCSVVLAISERTVSQSFAGSHERDEKERVLAFNLGNLSEHAGEETPGGAARGLPPAPLAGATFRRDLPDVIRRPAARRQYRTRPNARPMRPRWRTARATPSHSAPQPEEHVRSWCPQGRRSAIPNPRLSKASEGVPASTGNGRKAQASPAGQPTELHGAGDDGTASAAPGTGSLRRRRGGRGRSHGAGAASVEAAVEANAVGSDGSRAEGASPGRTSAPHEARARGATTAQTRRGSTVPAVPVQPPSASGPVPGVDAPVQRLSRDRRGRPVGRYLMCVHVEHEATHIAVLEGRALIEHFVARRKTTRTRLSATSTAGE